MVEGTPVWSSDGGDLRKGGRGKRSRREAPGAAHGHPADGIVRVERRRGGRGGGWVTLVTGLPGDAKAELKGLKRLCGAGGAVRDGAVEIQGDHADRLVDHLKGRGLTVRRAGG
jgi:translation initiation factor 1